MIKIYTAADDMEAMALSDALREQGIESWIFSEGSGDYVKIVWGMSMQGSGIYVREEDEKKAAGIIKRRAVLEKTIGKYARESGYDADMVRTAAVPWYKNRVIVARVILGWLMIIILILCISQMLF